MSPLGNASWCIEGVLMCLQRSAHLAPKLSRELLVVLNDPAVLVSDTGTGWTLSLEDCLVITLYLRLWIGSSVPSLITTNHINWYEKWRVCKLSDYLDPIAKASAFVSGVFLSFFLFFLMHAFLDRRQSYCSNCSRTIHRTNNHFIYKKY